jgi:DNA-binding NtrC family response regulator
MNRVLIIDDDEKIRLAISVHLKYHGFLPLEASGGWEGIRIFQKENPAVILLDLKMPEMDGLETFQKIKEINSHIPVIFLTAHGDFPSAVKTIKAGAYDFISKPPNFELLALTLNRATEKANLRKKVQELSGEIETSLELLLGQSESMKNVIKQIQQVSHSDFSLILQGETGTGKSFIARAIHNLSKRAKGPFVTVDIGAVPETLVESELFGYEKGAFTGAEKSKKGFFEIANGGTILIDELQNLSLYVQSKLLMAVEEKKICPLGTTNAVKTDVRIIGATNRDMLRSVKENTFRKDLFYRLSEFMIYIPPLRERIEDIQFYAEKFFREVAEDLDKPLQGISESTISLLEKYPWPGNIRELKNVIRRAVLIADTKFIKPEHIKFLEHSDTAGQNMIIPYKLDEFPTLNLKEVEMMAVKKALDITKGNKTKAASLLKISYVTLLKKIKDYSVKYY